MPLRGLFYFSNLYRKYVETHGVNIYSRTQQMIPLPQYIVFYNNQAEAPESLTLNLSDAFIRPAHFSGQIPRLEIPVNSLASPNPRNRVR